MMISPVPVTLFFPVEIGFVIELQLGPFEILKLSSVRVSDMLRATDHWHHETGIALCYRDFEWICRSGLPVPACQVANKFSPLAGLG
jgi:hypothetical protein